MALPLRRWAATAIFGQKYREFTDRNLLLGSDHQYLEWAEKSSE